MTLVEKVYAQAVKMDSGCLVFTGASKLMRPTIGGEYVYRITYADAYGPIPDGMHIHHRCKNPRCVLPDHMELLTVVDHAVLHGREHLAHCKFGHSMDDHILVRYRSGVTQRRCRTCYAENRKRLRARIKANRPPRPPKPVKTHCKRGHEWTPENVTMRPNGKSYCKPCAALAMRLKARH